MFCVKIWILFLCAFILLNTCEASKPEQNPKWRKGKESSSKSTKNAKKIDLSEIGKIAAKLEKINEAVKKPLENIIGKIEVAATNDRDQAELIFRRIGTTLTSPKDDIYNLCNPRMETHRVYFCAWISVEKNYKSKFHSAECVNREIKKRAYPKEKGENIPVLECQNRDGGSTKKVLHRFLVFSTTEKYLFYATDRLPADQTGWTVHSIIEHKLDPEEVDYWEGEMENYYNKLPKSPWERRKKNLF